MQPLAATDSCPVYCSTAETAPSLVLSQHPLGLALDDSPTALPPDDENVIKRVILRRSSMAQLVTMQAKVIKIVIEQQARCKRYLYNKIRSLPIFIVGRIFYVCRPPLTTLAAERQTSAKYTKILPRTTGSLRKYERYKVRSRILAKMKQQLPFR